jgi:hypothetical protein
MHSFDQGMLRQAGTPTTKKHYALCNFTWGHPLTKLADILGILKG